MSAIAQDVQRIRSVMQELETLESMLCYEDALQELKGNIYSQVIWTEPAQLDLQRLAVPSVLVYKMECDDYPEIINEDSDDDIYYSQKSNAVLS